MLYLEKKLHPKQYFKQILQTALQGRSNYTNPVFHLGSTAFNELALKMKCLWVLRAFVMNIDLQISQEITTSLN